MGNLVSLFFLLFGKPENWDDAVSTGMFQFGGWRHPSWNAIYQCIHIGWALCGTTSDTTICHCACTLDSVCSYCCFYMFPIFHRRGVFCRHTGTRWRKHVYQLSSFYTFGVSKQCVWHSACFVTVAVHLFCISMRRVDLQFLTTMTT